MTNQEMYDTVIAGLASQGFERSVSAEGCMYRDGLNRKCAAGWLIPDELYSVEMEHRTITRILRGWPELCPYFAGEGLANALQKAHDQSYTPTVMKTALRTVAAAFNLTAPEVLND